MKNSNSPQFNHHIVRLLRVLFILMLMLQLVVHPQPARAQTKSTFIVNSMLDTTNPNDANPGNGICATASGDCTLRAAIQETNALAGADTITFDASVFTVIIQTALPALTDTSGGTTILGRSDYVYIQGYLSSSVTNGFQLDSNNNKIQGLDIVDFPGNGIVINGDNNIIGVDGDGINDASEPNIIRENDRNGIMVNSGSDNNRISGNRIGKDRNNASKPNLWNGIHLAGANNHVGVVGNGVSDDLEVNSISYNDQDGIFVSNNSNVIRGNIITTNEMSGIHISTCSLTKIGTNGDGIADSVEGNVISGNHEYGIYMYETSETIVAGNKVGTNAAGDGRFSNALGGIYVWESLATVIGTDGVGLFAANEGNLISGNTNWGVKIKGGAGTTVAGNKIGTDMSGTAAIENGVGVYIEASNFNIIGTDSDNNGDSFEGNLISGNHGNGITMTTLGSYDNFITGNLIGVNVDGTTALPNGDLGIWLSTGANENQVGTNGDGLSDSFERNIISGNSDCGISVRGNENVVSGNYIGLNKAGTAAIPNLNFGLCIVDGHFNIIGKSSARDNGWVEANIISGNQMGGIRLEDGPNETVANNILGNKIGTTPDGIGALPNSGPGILLENVDDNRIGFPSEYLGNLITNHPQAGIRFTSTLNSAGNQFIGNSIYGNSMGIDLGQLGVTYNDTADGDNGPNGLLNFPILGGAESTGDTISIAVSYNSKPSRTYGLDFYWTRTCSASGFGEGEVYLGYAPVTTDSSGNVGPSQIGIFATINRRGFITATATDSDGSTSEFSQCITLEGVDEFNIFLPTVIK